MITIKYKTINLQEDGLKILETEGALFRHKEYWFGITQVNNQFVSTELTTGCIWDKGYGNTIDEAKGKIIAHINMESKRVADRISVVRGHLEYFKLFPINEIDL